MQVKFNAINIFNTSVNKSVKRPCRISSDCFCNVCGYCISPQQKTHKAIPETKFIAYETYFGIKMGNLDKSWAPHFCCGSCRSTLEGWMRGSRKCMPFAIPRIWKEPTNHHDDCCFCMVDISKYNKTKDRKKIVFPSIPSSIAPVNHDQNCLFLNLQQRLLYHQPHQKMTMLILRLTLSVSAKILIFQIKMNWMI